MYIYIYILIYSRVIEKSFVHSFTQNEQFPPILNLYPLYPLIFFLLKY